MKFGSEESGQMFHNEENKNCVTQVVICRSEAKFPSITLFCVPSKVPRIHKVFIHFFNIYH